MSEPTPSLLIEGLAFAYPDGHQALFGVNLKVSQGECVAILGPNGAGKTTLVLHLNGIHPTSVGKVWIAGTLVDAKDKASLSKIRAKVGIVFQDPDDQLFMPTVGEDVAFGPYNMGFRGAELDDIVVATVLAMKPEILVLDEPSSNLDPASRRELADILRSLKITTLMVTHDIPYAYELCERSIILSGGIVVADGDTKTILSDSKLLRDNRLELPVGFSL